MADHQTTRRKPCCKLSETYGNMPKLAARAGKALRQAGHADQGQAMKHRLCQARSYTEAMRVIIEYVDVC